MTSKNCKCVEIISIEYISENVFNLSEQTEVSNIKRVLDDIPKGKTIVLVEGRIKLRHFY